MYDFKKGDKTKKEECVGRHIRVYVNVFVCVCGGGCKVSQSRDTNFTLFPPHPHLSIYSFSLAHMGVSTIPLIFSKK